LTKPYIFLISVVTSQKRQQSTNINETVQNEHDDEKSKESDEDMESDEEDDNDVSSDSESNEVTTVPTKKRRTSTPDKEQHTSNNELKRLHSQMENESLSTSSSRSCKQCGKQSDKHWRKVDGDWYCHSHGSRIQVRNNEKFTLLLFFDSMKPFFVFFG
jgi:hypothetical protein